MQDFECQYYEIYLTINETKAMRYHLIHKLVVIHKKF